MANARCCVATKPGVIDNTVTHRHAMTPFQPRATPLDLRPWPRSAKPALFDPARIALAIAVPDKMAALHEIGRLAQQRGGPAAQEIAGRLVRREARGSTALGQGVALPHANVPRLSAPLAVYLRPAQAIDFEAADGNAVSELLALLVPRPATAAHFDLLSRMTQRFMHPELRKAAARCSCPQELCELFSRWFWG
jgi:PTS system nitrogen regulatory IIA component